jgi:sulfatase maturation enzyme AslB (radical SAM superfamily)
MSLALSNLVLEITRKCNMRCPHCLRGPVQDLDMSTAIIDRVTTAAHHIFGITFTGGEPSLNAKTIHHLRWAAHFYECYLDYFWLTVNARFFKQDFYDAMTELYSVCHFKEDCSMTISGDQYHGKRSRKALEMYSELPFFSDMWLHRNIEDDQLLDEGMAYSNGIGRREKENIRTEITDYDLVGDSLYIGDMVYINAKGDVLLDCDLSYASQKRYTIGNVMTESLEEILRWRLKAQAA